MDSEKVIQDLNQRFAKPLPEFYKRRIIFWCDEEREFEDQLDELTGTNYVAVKKLLGVEDTTGNYVVYYPLSHEKPEDDWLLDIRLYSEEYRADLISNRIRHIVMILYRSGYIVRMQTGCGLYLVGCALGSLFLGGVRLRLH